MKTPQELFRSLEREVRTPKERLPIDSFLPRPEELPTEFPDPPPSQLTAHVRELGAEPDRRERRRVRRVKKPAPQQAENPQNIEDEIHEFLNRNKPEGVKEDDFSEFQGGFDPTEIPES